MRLYALIMNERANETEKAGASAGFFRENSRVRPDYLRTKSGRENEYSKFMWSA
jgi:hypothetical protein